MAIGAAIRSAPPLILSLLIVAIGLRGPEAPDERRADPPVSTAASRGRVNAVVIDAAMPELAAIEAGLRLRLADRGVTRSDRVRPLRSGELFAYLQQIEATAERARIRVTLTDGRGYLREILGPEHERTREIATNVANLLAAIEEDTVAPDEHDVPLPESLQPVAPPPPREPARPSAAPAIPPRFEWGLALAGDAVIGAGPPAPAGLAAVGGQLTWALRLRRGASFAVAVHPGGLRRRGWSTTRVAIAVGAGYVLRRGAFELASLALLRVEPWWLVRDGAAVPLGEQRSKAPLLGGAVRLSPRWRHRFERGRSLVIGPAIELAGSGMPTRDGGVVRVRERAGASVRDVSRVGGLELTLGLELGVWLPG